ncbi:hypothetical protein AVEN_30398-1 [Araneus ventricosus]|uniref:Uncharacterized protein n=1 Tax=Araneus ventricosus TaxID=182803 RepID=A0A4Y2FLC1_ARAVE|nr:hypothetical protein AVEN_30398-1 [Araneus ventricosus]
MVLVILNHGQRTRVTPELAAPSPNFHNTAAGGRFANTWDLTCNAAGSIHDGSSVESGFEPGGLRLRGRAATFTVDDVVNKAGYGKFQIILLFLSGLGWIADSCEIFIITIVSQFLACDWTLTREQPAIITYRSIEEAMGQNRGFHKADLL